MWAYGSNLNVEQMKIRCPGARVYGPLVVPQAILRFRGVADVARHETAKCPGGLWWITPEDEAILDRYEGVSSGLYQKRYLLLRDKGKVVDCLFYKMRSRGIMPPSDRYLESIAQGYVDFGLDTAPLYEAFEHSWRAKEITNDMRRRYVRRNAKAAREMPNVEFE
jgi:hypothetical protein